MTNAQQQQISPQMMEQLSKWQDEVNSLCHQVFFQTEAGQRLLNLWEGRFFNAPVASPYETDRIAVFKEGRNDMIRSIRASAFAAAQPSQPTHMKRDIEHGNEDGQE